MIANDLGFTTMGSNVLKAEIPVGWHTGKHRHGEESMHILEGEGFSIIAGQRFDWHKSSTLQIPYWAEHQHFNTGKVPVLYVSGMAFDLERFVRVARLEQIETCGPNDPADDRCDPGRRTRNTIRMERARSSTSRTRRPTTTSYEPQGNIAALKNQHDFLQYLVVPKNGFRAISVPSPINGSSRRIITAAATSTWRPWSTLSRARAIPRMQGKRVAWEAGDVLYVPPAMWEHEHMNDNPNPIKQLRIAFGIRTVVHRDLAGRLHQHAHL